MSPHLHHLAFKVQWLLYDMIFPKLEPIMYQRQRDIQYFTGCFQLTSFPRYSQKLLEQSKLSSNSLESTVLLSINFPLQVCHILYPYYRSSSILKDYNIERCYFLMSYETQTILRHTSAFFFVSMLLKLILIIEPSYKETYIFWLHTFTSKISLVSLYKALKATYHLRMCTLTISMKVQKYIITY